MPLAKAIFSFVPTPSQLATSTGSRICGKSPLNIPPKLPMSERTLALKVVWASRLIRDVATLAASISTPASL